MVVVVVAVENIVVDIMSLMIVVSVAGMMF